MAKEHQYFNKINFLSLRAFGICVVWVYILQTYRVSGAENFHDNYMTSRIIGGNEADAEEWPFIAALYLSKRSKYFCGGTLISNKHVLTAAHCIQGKGSDLRLSADDIEVRLGAYNLTVKCEEGVALTNVTDIYIHPDWNVNHDRYDADLAILVLSDKVIFATTISPISLPAYAVGDGSNINVNGTIVGWGLAVNQKHAEIPRQAAVRAFNHSHCFLTYADLVAFSSARTFCAGSEEGNPSQGDSGGGLFVKSGTGWIQYGIISSIRTNETGHVVRYLASIYTNTASFKNWIMKIIEESGGEVVEDFHCKYIIFDRSGYQCNLIDLDIRNDNIEASFTASHLNGKTDAHVTDIAFISGTMFFLPNGIGKTFTNLRALRVHNFHYLSTKQITRAKLKNLQNLRQLKLQSSEIEVLQFDTLWDLPLLHTFEFIYSKLKVLDERMFEKNDNLKILTLKSNRLEFLPRNIFKNNKLLEEINLRDNALNTIQTDFSTLTNARNINLEGNTCFSAMYTIPGYPGSRIITDFGDFLRQLATNCSSTK